MDVQRESKTAEEKLDQLISFAMGDEDYGVDIQTVKEVIRKKDITRLPKAPAFVKGVINLRGDVIPIIDLREKFIVLLNINNILTSEERIQLDSIEGIKKTAAQ